MKYCVFPASKPTEMETIYVVGPVGAEELAIFKGGNRFDLQSGKQGYYAKWWRCLTDTERLSFDSQKTTLRTKRKYTKRSVK